MLRPRASRLAQVRGLYAQGMFGGCDVRDVFSARSSSAKKWRARAVVSSGVGVETAAAPSSFGAPPATRCDAEALGAEELALILDEPSLGLAPKLVEQVRDTIVGINEQGTSVLLIEQNAIMALSIANYGYIMETGKVVMDGDGQKLLADDDVKEFYLGLHSDGGEKKSFKEVKHYKRRKRWAS